MKLLLDRGARSYLVGATAAILLIAGCSSGRSLPSAGGGAGVAPSTQVTATLTVTGVAPEGVVSDTCTNPVKFKVCLPPGGKGVLGIKLTCTKSSVTVSCGKVRWSTKMSNSGLKGSFKPNPGNPTKETVTASKSVKKGHYHQIFTAKCTAFPSCVEHGKGAVWVI